MIKTIAIIALIFVTQFFSLTVFAQQQSQEENTSKNTYTLNLGRIILNEARFGLERQISERHYFRTNIGIKYSNGEVSFDSYEISFLDFPSHYKVSRGVYLGLGYNYILGQKSRIYVSPEIYYSFNYYNDKYYNHSSGQDVETYTSLESMLLRKAGLKVLFGKKMDIVSNSKIKLGLDIFAGVGLQYRVNEITKKGIYRGGLATDYSDLDIIDPAVPETSNIFYPTFHFGVLVGISFVR